MTTTAYAANQVTVTTKNGNITRTSTKKYNAAGWIIESIDNFGGIVKNEYNCNGNLSKSCIGDNQTTAITLEYDQKGNRTLLKDPNYGTMKTVYNAYGELVTKTNPRNETSSFTYDKLGRMTKETGGPEGDITWTYSTSPGRIGTLENIIKNNHRTNYVYDNFLRLTSETEIIDGASYITHYTCDELGRPFTTTYPTGIKLRDGYNDYGYHTSVTLENNSTKIWKTVDVNAIGLVTKFKTGNGLVTDQTYYPLTMRPYTVKTAKPGGNPIQDLEYGWFGLGNMEYRKKWLNRTNNTSLTESFTYDGLDRLITIGLNGTNTGYHMYDNYPNTPNLGNLTFKYSEGNNIISSAIYGTNGYGPHAITEVTTANPILTGPRQHITYNGYDKVKTITEGNHSLSIQYGHHKQRISQQYSDGANTIDKVWAGVCEYITKNGQQYKHTYLTGPMGVFAIHIIKPDGTEEINYIHTDHLGSWNTITDKDGNLLQELSFDAWGNRRDPDTWRAFTSAPEYPLFDRGFTGHEHLYAFNLINMNGRFYDPIIGRMLSPDNFMQAPDYTQSFNRYSYCFNNPLTYTDPTGYVVGWDDLIVGGIGFTFGYVSHGLSTGDWGWNAVGAGAIGAGTFLLGYYSGGTSSASSIANTFAAAPAAGNGYAATVALGYSGRMVASSAISSMLPSISMPIGDNFNLNVSAGIGFGSNGLVSGFNVSGSFRDGEETYTLGGGVGTNHWAWSLSYANKSFSLGYYSTHYGNAIGPDGIGNKQTVGAFSYSRGDFSLRFENDFLTLGSHDRWRSNAVEIGIGDAILGTTLYNNYVSGEKGSEVDYSGNYSHDKGRYGRWVDGQTYSSPLYLGFRTGNNVSRLGYSHKVFQHAFQNIFTHKSGFAGIMPFGHANYFMGYDKYYKGPYSYSGYYNPYSLWGK